MHPGSGGPSPPGLPYNCARLPVGSERPRASRCHGAVAARPHRSGPPPAAGGLGFLCGAPALSVRQFPTEVQRHSLEAKASARQIFPLLLTVSNHTLWGFFFYWHWWCLDYYNISLSLLLNKEPIALSKASKQQGIYLKFLLSLYFFLCSKRICQQMSLSWSIGCHYSAYLNAFQPEAHTWHTVGKISIWTPADFASLATCKEMCDL